MALQGNIVWTTVELSETETQDQILTYPDEMHKDDPNYDKRGQTETIQVAKETYTSNSYTDVYLYVKSIQMHTFTNDGVKSEQVHFHFAGYEGKETRNNDNEGFLFFDGGQLQNYDPNQNLWSQCYNQLKSREDFADLKDC
jgi:hypothetical protein